MCLAVYISLNKSLPIIEKIEGKVGFYIREIKDYEINVRQRFSNTFVYYLGSAEGCSCNFLMDGVYPDMPEFYQVKESYRLLLEFLQLEIGNETIEIYACWSGEENRKPEKYEKGKVSDLVSKEFGFEEGCFYTLENVD